MPPVNRNQPKRAKSSESQFSLMEFMRDFPDDNACLEFLWRTRYAPDGQTAYCPKCDDDREFRRYEHSQQRQAWTCVACGKHLAPTAGTIFHKSSTSLHLWFYAMYLMASTRCGISAKQLERELGVTYKTAYRMGQLIRKHLMAQDGKPFKGGEPIEIDETYVGGHAQRVYVSGDVHTNTIEGFWSLVKRGLDGVFHGVSKKHL
jgi:transposase-like protein